MITKKFLDANGVTYLVQLLNNYPDNELLSTVIDAIDSIKADKDSPELTGVPTAPTAEAGTSTDQIATTAFVMQSISPSVRIDITPATQGITATLTLTNGTYSASGVSNTNGTIIIPLEYFGKYRISYSDPRCKSDSIIEISSSVQQNIAATFNELVVYTLRIDEQNSNPVSACIYLDDAATMTKGSTAWDSLPIFNEIKPCVLNDGIVSYYLNPNNFNQKIDGTASVLTGEDGDVMIEFRKFGYKIWKEEDRYLYVSITNNMAYAAENDYCFDAFSRCSEGDLDKFYQGAFKGYVDEDGKLRSIVGVQPTANKTIAQFRTAAQANGTNNKHYQQSTYAHLIALQCLYLIKYGSLNGQEAVGNGYVGITDGGSTNMSHNTGTTVALGMTYGTTSNSTTQMKLFGIEDFWGNIWEWIDGLTSDANCNLITSWNSYSGELDENGLPIETTTNTFTTGITSNSYGWVTKVSGTSTSGFISIQWGGSSSTFWSDYGRLYSSCVADFGGRWYNGLDAGPFYLHLHYGAATASRNVGARLSYN